MQQQQVVQQSRFEDQILQKIASLGDFQRTGNDSNAVRGSADIDPYHSNRGHHALHAEDQENHGATDLVLRNNPENPSSTVEVRTSILARSCAPLCKCACHESFRLRSPNFLDCILGRVFVGYSATPSTLQACDKQYCVRSLPGSSIIYYFPQWFLTRVVYITMASVCVDGPTASLKVRRTVPSHAKVFIMTMENDLDGLRELFRTHKASPNDVNYDLGETPLFVR